MLQASINALRHRRLVVARRRGFPFGDRAPCVGGKERVRDSQRPEVDDENVRRVGAVRDEDLGGAGLDVETHSQAAHGSIHHLSSRNIII